MKHGWTILAYVAVAMMGTLSAYMVVRQFMPEARSQTELQELDPGLMPPEGFDAEPLEEIDPFSDPTMAEELPADEPIDEPLQALPGPDSMPEALPQAGAPGEESGVDAMQLLNDGYVYEPTGKRNPFKPFFPDFNLSTESEEPVELHPLQRFDLTQLKLVGIMWDIDDPKAMIVDPSDQVYVRGKNDKIGRNNGYIAIIREGEIVIVESFEEGGEMSYNTRTMSLD